LPQASPPFIINSMTYKTGTWGEQAKLRSKKRAAYFRENRHSAKNLGHRYGITVEDYKKLLKKQKGKCAICLKEEWAKNRDGTIQNLAIDHDHITGNIRGLLCFSCNRGIGYLKDSIEILKAALVYLQNNEAIPSKKENT